MIACALCSAIVTDWQHIMSIHYLWKILNSRWRWIMIEVSIFICYKSHFRIKNMNYISNVLLQCTIWACKPHVPEHRLCISDLQATHLLQALYWAAIFGNYCPKSHSVCVHWKWIFNLKFDIRLIIHVAIVSFVFNTTNCIAFCIRAYVDSSQFH